MAPSTPSSRCAGSAPRRRRGRRSGQSMAGEALGPLHGLPIGIKDLALTADLRTTFGSPQFADFVPEADERQVAAVRLAGAIVIGKTNTPEFGAGANTVNPVYGATGNPFDPEKTCAGSSGGSAVALADRHGAARNRLGHGRLVAQSRGVLRRRRFPSEPGHGAARAAPDRLVAARRAGPDGPHRGRHRPAVRGHGGLRCPRPAIVSVACPRRTGVDRPRQPARRDQRGSRLRAGRRRHPRECFATP